MPIYREQPASPSIARWVECGWFLQSGAAVTEHRVPPDGCLDIIYERGRGLIAVGTMTAEQRFSFPYGAYLTGIRFRPGMAGPFLGLSPSELTDGSVPLEDLWSRRASELKRRLDDANVIQDALRILLDHIPTPGVAPNPVQRVIEALAAANGCADLNAAAHQAHLSPRQFRRRCLEESGLTPKRLCRVLRFRHACSIARGVDRLDWPGIALEAGYFDQAHLIRDFREFTRLTPNDRFFQYPAKRSG